jgi:thiol:disulfide interchange protein
MSRTFLAFLILGLAIPALADDDPFAPTNKAADSPAPKVAKAATAKKNPLADRIRFDVAVTPQKARPGETVKLTFKGTPVEGYYTYPLTVRTEEQNDVGLATLTVEGPGMKPLFPVAETEPELVIVEGLNTPQLEHKKPFTWSQDVLVLPDAKPGTHKLRADLKLQVCNDQNCLPGGFDFEVPVEVAGEPVPLSADLQARMKVAPPPVKIWGAEPTPAAPKAEPTKAAPPAAPQAAPATPPSTPKNDGLWAFVLSGVFWGAVSLVTPCVFPMIPITVSFFLKQSEKQNHKALTLATVYSLTIVVVLTIAAVALLSVFRELSIHWAMNFGLGALFIFFALSLFGMYEIELPQGLAQFTSSKEGQGGLVGTMFMALTFTIISFACVAPFLGGFGGTSDAANLTLLHRILGGLAFSVTFASPFFVLALFPALLKKMPKSGSWLNAVKVVMGFLELAAALKFLRQGELVLLPEPVLFTYDLVLGLYVALSILCGMYLLGVYRLPHDTPMENLGVPRLLFAAAFLGLALYIAPALFKDASGHNQRPGGDVFAWLDSFLLPEDRPTVVAAGGKSVEGELAWTGSLEKGIQEAKAKGRLVFVDFTGKTCTNCKINEKNVFPRPEVKDQLRQYQLVQLYTDIVPNHLFTAEERAQFGNDSGRQRADAQKNLQFQREKFDTEQLPLYVILEPRADGGFREVARYAEGKINDVAAFVEFLRKPLQSGTSVAGLQTAGK